MPMLFSTKPNRQETFLGTAYLLLDMLVLPTVIPIVHMYLGSPLSLGQLNFLFFAVNFMAVAVIFRRYLAQSVRDAMLVPFPTIWYAVLGYLGCTTLNQVLSGFILAVYPQFMNVNDNAISGMLVQDFRLMALGTIVLAPVAEEVLYRGLIFRSLYDRSPVLAYCVSTAIFAAVHVLTYIGSFEPVLLLLCFLQYLPAGYCLAFCYHYSGNIFSPIFMHMITNIAAVAAMR